MRISGVPPIQPRDLSATRSKSGVFTVTGEAPARPAGNPVQPATSVSMLVALAAADDEVERRRRMAEQAERGLDALEQLDKDMIEGRPTVDKLRAVAAWSRGIAPPADPELARLVSDIELRALIELAKQERED